MFVHPAVLISAYLLDWLKLELSLWLKIAISMALFVPIIGLVAAPQASRLVAKAEGRTAADLKHEDAKAQEGRILTSEITLVQPEVGLASWLGASRPRTVKSRREIFVIEDEPDLAIRLEVLIADLGNKTIGSATSVDTAFSKLNELRENGIVPDVAVVDALVSEHVVEFGAAPTV